MFRKPAIKTYQRKKTGGASTTINQSIIIKEDIPPEKELLPKEFVEFNDSDMSLEYDPFDTTFDRLVRDTKIPPDPPNVKDDPSYCSSDTNFDDDRESVSIPLESITSKPRILKSSNEKENATEREEKLGKEVKSRDYRYDSSSDENTVPNVEQKKSVKRGRKKGDSKESKEPVLKKKRRVVKKPVASTYRRKKSKNLNLSESLKKCSVNLTRISIPLDKSTSALNVDKNTSNYEKISEKVAVPSTSKAEILDKFSNEKSTILRDKNSSSLKNPIVTLTRLNVTQSHVAYKSWFNSTPNDRRTARPKSPLRFSPIRSTEITERNENESYYRMPEKSRVRSKNSTNRKSKTTKSSNLNEQQKDNSMTSKPLSVSPDPEPSGLMFDETDIPISHAGSYISLVESGNKNDTEASTNSPFMGFSRGTNDASLVPKTRPAFRTALAPIEHYYETTDASTSGTCKKFNKESTDSESFRLTFDGSDKTDATSKEFVSSLDKSRSGYRASLTNNSKDATDANSFKVNAEKITENNSEQFSNDDDWATIPDSLRDDLSLSKIADDAIADCGKSNSIVHMSSVDDNGELNDVSGSLSQMVIDNQETSNFEIEENSEVETINESKRNVDETSVFEVTCDNNDDKVSLKNPRRSSIQPVVLLSRLNLSAERSKRMSNVKETKFHNHSVSMKSTWESSSLNDDTNEDEKSTSELMEWERSENEYLQESQVDMESLKVEELSGNTTKVEESAIMEISERDSSKGSFRLSINEIGNTSEKCSSKKNDDEDCWSWKKDFKAAESTLNASQVKETSIEVLDTNLQKDNRSVIQPIVLLNRLNDPTRITDRRKKYRNWGLSVITENADGKTIEEEPKELVTVVTDKNETKVEGIEKDIRLSDDGQNKVSQETTISYDASVLSNQSNESMRLDKIVFLKPGKSWSRSLSLFRQVHNQDDIETLAVGKGKKWRQSVRSLLDMQQQGVIQSCVKKNEDDKESQSCYGVRNSAAAWIPGSSQPDTSRVLSQTSVGSPGSRFIRRVSIRVVPDSKNTEHYEDSPFLEAYGITSCENRKTLGKRSTLIAARKTLVYNVECADLSFESIPKSLNSVTSRDVVLTQCGQVSSVPFDEYYPDTYLKHCRKIGEGVFGEVYLYEKDTARTVIKIIPIEGDMKVNGERQKKFDEILSEIVIAKELNNLRYADSCKTSSFVEVKNIRCVYGKYPEMLIDLWQRWDNEKNSENDCPDMFNKSQLYIVLELGHGGHDLEAFVFQNSSEAHALFIQTALALAVAEESLEFEHRDLHWGNILISRTEDTQINYKLRGKNITVASKGVKVSVIDFTLSRMSYQGCSIFNDLSLDDDLFAAQGEYQFEIYRLMRQKIENNWQTFEPYTNIYWLHYTLDKMITAVRYRRPTSKIHKNGIGRLKELKNEILDYNSAYDFVTNCDNVTRLLGSNSSVSKVTSTD